MGLIANLLSFVRAERNDSKISDVTVDPGGGANITSENFAPSGDDSFPVNTDVPVLIKIPGNGKYATINYLDPVSEPKSLIGEKRIYSRSEGGDLKSEIWLKNTGEMILENSNGTITIKTDGEIVIENSSGFINLKSDGTIELNGNADFAIAFTDMKASFDTLKTELNTFITVFNAHTHQYSPGPSPPAPTAAPSTPGTPAAADMSGAKVDTVKLP
jgi:hypothetical protein